MRRTLFSAAVLVVASISGCSFVLDFDSLQEGDAATSSGGTGGTGGTATSSGGSAGEASGGMGGVSTTSAGGSSTSSTTGAAGEAGAPGCDSDCNDNNPCTLDSCDTSADPPRCANDYQTGVVPDGFDVTLEGDQFQRVTLISGPNRFYMSAFETGAGGNQTVLYGLGRDDDALEELFDAADLGVSGEPVSVMGLAPDTAAGFTLHGYMAFNDVVGADDALGRVYYVQFSDFDAPTSQLMTTAYDASQPLRYPKTLKTPGLGNAVYGAWITPTGTVQMHEARSNTTQAFNASAAGAVDPVVAFSTIASPNLPGVVYARQSGDVFAELEGVMPNPLNRCLSGNLSFMTLSSTWMQIEGFWFADWSVFTADELGNDSKALVCADAGCLSEACEAGDEAFNFVRNPAVATTRRQGDGPGVVFIASALPTFAVNGDDSTDAELRLAILRIDFGDNLMNTENAETEILADLSVSRMPTDAALSGPNLPALSFMPPNKLALAWIEPSGDAATGALRVQRYQMCLPEAD